MLMPYPMQKNKKYLCASDFVHGRLFYFADYHMSLGDAADAEPVQPSRCLTGDSFTFVRRIEHARMAAAFEQGMRGRSAADRGEARGIADEIDFALLVRAGQAERAQLAGRRRCAFSE